MRNSGSRVWYSAYGFSLLLHVLLFVAVTIIQPFNAQQPNSQYIELELVSAFGTEGGGGGYGNGRVGGGGGNGNPYSETELKKIINQAPPAQEQEYTATDSVQQRTAVSAAANDGGDISDDASTVIPQENRLPTASSASGIGKGTGGGIGGGEGTGIGSGSGDGTGGGRGTGLGNGTGSGIGSGSGAGIGSGHGSGTGEGILAPRLLKMQEPEYPQTARIKGIEGTVVVKIEVLPTGKAGAIEIVASSGSDDLDRAALDAVKLWRFIPAKDQNSGQPITCYTSVPIVFRLT